MANKMPLLLQSSKWEWLQYLPTAGYIVIGIVVLTIVLFVYIVIRDFLKKKKFSFEMGNKKVSFEDVGQEMLNQQKEFENKLLSFKEEMAQNEKYKLHDDELRKSLFNISNEIDTRLKADEKRIVRKSYEEIRMLFKPYMKCEMVGLSASEILKDELEERVDYNSMREKLNKVERKGYIDDILYNMSEEYRHFLLKFPALPCGTEKYPKWHEIKNDVERIVNNWADEIIRVIGVRIKEKISLYEESRNSFILDESKDFSIDKPIEKNKKYLKNLGIIS